MRVARAFSTSLRNTKQALYEPYHPPINNKQKKALRKLMAADMPNFHSKLSKDAAQMLKMYSVDEILKRRRHNTLQRVTEIIRSAFGPEYSVMDQSLSQYSKDSKLAPLELTITDESRPTGFPPEQIGSQFPEVYNHESLAKLLQEHGYTGSFIAGDAMRNKPPARQDSAQRILPAVERGPYPITHPWPTYTSHLTSYLTYPPVLWAEPGPRDSHTVSFFLSPPVPTHAPLLRLLTAYTSTDEQIRSIVTFIFLWTRSIDMAELTPTCIALMVIAFLQHEKSLPSLQNPEDKEEVTKLAEKGDGVWFTSARPTRDHAEPMFSSTWLETGFVTPREDKLSKKHGRQFGTLLHGFFNFWSLGGRDSTFVPSSQYVSVREGTLMQREKRVNPRDRYVLELDDKNILRGLVPSLDDQPTMWQSQPIVVQDPFVPSFNHAQSVSRVAGKYFQDWCSFSRRSLSRSHPMATIIGPSFQSTNRPKFGRTAVRAYSTALISQEITRLYETNRPPRSILDARKGTIARVQDVIHKRFGNGFTVECFGSTRYGVSNSKSDLDLVVIDHKKSNGIRSLADAKRLPAVYNVWVVARALQSNGFIDVLPIPKAKVPIVKFRDPRSNLHCDLNANEQLGLHNTRLLAQYCDIAPTVLRPIIVVIKHWAKSHGLNDASGSSGPATFSSYALILMIIGYLQIRDVLPSLQAGLEPLPDDAKQGVFWVRSKARESTRCDVRFKSGHDWELPMSLDVGEVLLGWFKFWAHEFTPEENILNIREGRLGLRRTRRKKKNPVEGSPTELVPQADDIAESGTDEASTDSEAWQPSGWRNDALVVVDPFITNKNVCGNIGKAIELRFRMECRRCVQMLEWGADLESLMGAGGSSSRKGSKRERRRGPKAKGTARVEVVPQGDAQVADIEQDNKQGDVDRGPRLSKHDRPVAHETTGADASSNPVETI